MSRTSKLIAIIDDDESICDSLRDLMESAGLLALCFGSAREFLESGLHCQAHQVPERGILWPRSVPKNSLHLWHGERSL